MTQGHLELIIVGTGFSGLAMAIKLKKAGIDNFVLLEQAGEVGGTWRENHYPGAACDIPSLVYSFAFEPNPNWSRMFSPQAEIFSYLKHCADKYQLRPHIRFHHTMEAAAYDEQQGLWTVELKGQQALVCRYLIMATGGLSRPSFPDIPQRQDFQGTLLHTAQWRTDHRVEGTRMAVIGTGASAIQIVPRLAEKAAHLTLFQRTPAWILPKADRAYTDKEKFLMAQFPFMQALRRKLLYWQYEWKAVALLRPQLISYGHKMAMEYLKEEIKDPELRSKVTPHYAMGCKRILLSNDFYASLCQSNVSLETEAIEKFTARGIQTKDGREHAFDTIVCATGFQVAEAAAHFPIKGRQGLELTEVWKEGAQAYLGTTIAGFPNLFMLLGPNVGLGHNSIIFMIESQVRYILGALKKVSEAPAKTIEVKASVQLAYNEALQSRFQKTVWTRANCRSWYQTPSGKNTTIWPGFSFEFRVRTMRFDAASFDIK